MAGKIKTLTAEIVVRTGNYESLRLGCEFTPATDDITAEMVKADVELRAAASAIIEERRQTAQPAQQDGRTLVRFKEDFALLQKILDKVPTTPEATVRKYYTFDEEAEKCVKLAYSLNSKE